MTRSTVPADHDGYDASGLTDPAGRLSAHVTSEGTVVYYRCSCGQR